MIDYTAPLDEINFLLNDVLNLDEVLKEDKFKDFSGDLMSAVLNEAGKFAAEKLSPLNASGDKQGSHAKDGQVTTPDGFKEAYAEFVQNGWNSVSSSVEHGGQGLPWMVSTAISEMWSSANMAFALCPLLTQGSVELLTHHGSDEQKEKYLQKLVSGEWAGTMCLTEPSAGSDVGAVSTKAVKNGDHYLISGQKIFITYGEHDFTENIIHMVLARTSDAPKGTNGISLFIVPKFLDDGSRNDLKAISIEHKLGIHASPTAVLGFGDNDGAIGYLVGEENSGLKYMFTMMNNARLAVGVEGVAISENSYQKAIAFAQEREQFGQTIDNFSDVKRMLLTIKANTEAMRALSYYVAKSMDVGNKKVVDLLIPVLKAHATDLGVDMSSMAVQIFGGVGYVEETGIVQNLRDARIAPIYEGTNGIQAIDLVMRKISMEGAFEELLAGIKPLYESNTKVAEAVAALQSATEYMHDLVQNDAEKAGFVAVYYLKMFGVVMGAVMMAACAKALNGESEFTSNKKQTIEFYMDYILPEVGYFERVIS